MGKADRDNFRGTAARCGPRNYTHFRDRVHQRGRNAIINRATVLCTCCDRLLLLLVGAMLRRFAFSPRSRDFSRFSSFIFSPLHLPPSPARAFFLRFLSRRGSPPRSRAESLSALRGEVIIGITRADDEGRAQPPSETPDARDAKKPLVKSTSSLRRRRRRRRWWLRAVAPSTAGRRPRRAR